MPAIEPHGGRLVYNVLEGDAAGLYWEVSTRLEVRPTLGPDGPPIRNPYREIMSIAYGFFSPLEGVMTWNVVGLCLRRGGSSAGGSSPSSVSAQVGAVWGLGRGFGCGWWGWWFWLLAVATPRLVGGFTAESC
jgi:hypothetical protein